MKLLICNTLFQKVSKQKAIFFFRQLTVGFCLKLFKSLKLLEIKRKLFFKIDGMSLGWHVLIKLFAGLSSLRFHFVFIHSRNNSFLSVFIRFYPFVYSPIYIRCNRTSWVYSFRICDGWQDEVLNRSFVGFVNSVVLSFSCFKKTITSRK